MEGYKEKKPRWEYRPNITINFLIVPLMLIIALSVGSCTSLIFTAEERGRLPSAYTHQGKYKTHKSISGKRDGIVKRHYKCPVPPKRKLKY